VIDRLRDRLPATTEIWAAGEASACRRRSDRTLFDSGSGGTGQPFDWSLIAGREALPTAFLAGGITPANAAAAAQVGAYGLDVGSGVEAAPGIKDPAKVAALFAALRPASRTDR
jgi:indole-3-glycerol phosphate synthase/phosphoribosylanthranilate isomerase